MVGKFQDDFEYGKMNFCQATEDEDMKQGIDGFIGSMKVATRRFRVPLSLYNAISIRKRLYSKSEFDKILAGTFKSVLYIFEYTDFFIICRVEDIATCLRQNLFTEKPNQDGLTSGCYIQLGLLLYLAIPK